MAKKAIKDNVINVRLTSEQKKKYTEEARECNMKLSEYVLHLLQNKQITVIRGGAEIANAMYDLNNTLNKCMKYPNIPVNKTQEALSNSIRKLNSYMEIDNG